MSAHLGWKDVPGIAFAIFFVILWVRALVSLLRWGSAITKLPGLSRASWYARRSYIWENRHSRPVQAETHFGRFLFCWVCGIAIIGIAVLIG